MRSTDILDLRFNSGLGALVCSRCQRSLASGFEHEGQKYTCKNCDKKYNIIKQCTTEGVYHFANYAEDSGS